MKKSVIVDTNNLSVSLHTFGETVDWEIHDSKFILGSVSSESENLHVTMATSSLTLRELQSIENMIVFNSGVNFIRNQNSSTFTEIFSDFVGLVENITVQFISIVDDNSFARMKTNSIKFDFEMLFVIWEISIFVHGKNGLHLNSSQNSLSRVRENNDEVVSFCGNVDCSTFVEDGETKLSHSDDHRGKMSDAPFSGCTGESTKVRDQNGNILVFV